MKTNLKKLFALLLTLAMVLPMTQGIVPASAEETAVEELPTETQPATGDQTDSTGQTMITAKTWDFSDESQLADFTLYQSADTAFTVADGMLKPSGANGEMKAILNQAPEGYKSVSVDMIPGESGTIYAGLYFGASNAANEQDAISSQAFLIKSDYDPAGWADAANRIDIVQGQFNGGWKHISTKISETGNKNNLFSGGNKQPLRLKLTFGGDVVLVTLSLVSNSSKYVQYMYEYDAADLQGQIGLRTIGSDTCFDNLTFEYESPVPEGTVIWDLNTMVQARDFTIPEGDGKAEFSGAYLLAQGTSNSIHHQKLITLERDLKNLKSISFDILSGTTSRNWGGICLFNDAETFTVNAGSYWNTQENYNDCRIQMTGVDNVDVADFFTTGTSRTRNNFNVTLTFADGMVTATVTRLTDEPVTMTSSAPFDMATWEGQLGFWVHGSQVYYDNLEIVYDQSAKAINTYTSTISASEQDQYIVPEGDGSVTFSATGMVVAGTSSSIHYQKLVTYNQTFKNIKSVSYDMYSGSTARNYGGISLHNADGTKFDFSAGGKASSTANFNNLYMEATGLSETNFGTFYNTSAKKRNPINVKLEFKDAVVNVTVTNLTTSTVATKSIALDMENWEGQIGFWVHGSRVEYRNLIVVCEEENQCCIAPPTEGLQIPQDTVSYVNTGYNFSTASNTWKLTKDVAATPYTLEAWVKLPVGLADNVMGNIIGNTFRAPRISMEIASSGRPQLTYAFEDAALNVVTNTYAVDVDLRAGQWIHLAYTMDVANDTVICYINGHVMQSWTDAGLQAVTIPDHVKPVNMYQVGSSSLLGWVADVRMWDHPLTAEEIASSMMTQYTQPKGGLMFNAPLSAQVDSTFADLSGYGNTVAVASTTQVWSDEVHEPGSYSMVVIPDQQILTNYYPELLNNMYQWIADNRDKENIQIVMNMGDMADNCGNVEQWERSKAAWELLPDDLPFIAVPGNHDYDTNSGWNQGYGVREQLTLMNQYFPMSIFENYATDFGALSRDQGVEDNVANTYQAFEVNGNKYLILALEYVPREDTIAWANEVISAHSDYQVIITTHNYVQSNGNLSPTDVWGSLVSQHENVIMAMGGHCDNKHIVRRIDKGVNNNNVLNMLLDSQLNDFNQVGMLGLLRFNAEGTVCDVSYYSTVKGMYDAESSFTVELPKQEHNYVAKAGMWSYESIGEALTNANGETVKILNDTDEAVNITSDVTIDLAGCKLSNVTVAEGGKLNLIDSTADYAGTKGSATVISGKVESLVEHDGKKYMVIGENGVYAPHRYYVGITNVSLAPNVTGFGYKAEFYGDEKVQAQVQNIGYDLWLSEDRVISKTTGFKNTLTLRLKNFMVAQYGETPVNAKVYMTLTDGSKLESAIHSYSMRGVVEEINETYADYTAEDLQAVAAMIQNNATMQAWTVANIIPATDTEAVA